MMNNEQAVTSVPTRPFHKRGGVVFMVGLSASILLISGFVLFIAPSGRIANTTQWAVLWLDKSAWVNLHNVFAILFIAGLIWHLAFNWKPLSNYVVSRATHHLNLKREMLAAVAVIIALVVLAAEELPPVDYLADLAFYFRHEFGSKSMSAEGSAMTITIYHNPACGTSRNVLAMIRNSGEEPHIIEYLKTPPSRAELADLIARMGITPRQLLRRKGTPYDALGLDNPAITDDRLIDMMIGQPILINRPIVVSPLGVKLCRPSEAVLDLLPNRQHKPFIKEDGTPVVTPEKTN